MANYLIHTLKVIDTFGADVQVASKGQRIAGMVITGLTAAKAVRFIDDDGQLVLGFETSAAAGDSTLQFLPAQPFPCPNGLSFDDSASGLAAGDLITVWLEY